GMNRFLKHEQSHCSLSHDERRDFRSSSASDVKVPLQRSDLPTDELFASVSTFVVLKWRSFIAQTRLVFGQRTGNELGPCVAQSCLQPYPGSPSPRWFSSCKHTLRPPHRFPTLSLSSR